MIWLRAGTAGTTCQYKGYDTSGIAALPAAEAAWQRDSFGPGAQVVDNAAAIQAGIAANNARYPTEEAKFPTPTSPTTAAGVGGMSVSGAGGMNMPPRQPQGGGCGCHVDAGAGAGALPWGAATGVLALALVRRRRRPRA